MNYNTQKSILMLYIQHDSNNIMMKYCKLTCSTRFLPMTSWMVYPTRRIAHWFHTLTRPIVSTPNIGALAVSISLEYSRSWAKRAVIWRWDDQKIRKTEKISLVPYNKLTSCPIPTTPMILPCSSFLVVALRSTSSLMPPLVMRGNSKFLGIQVQRTVVRTMSKILPCDSHNIFLTQFPLPVMLGPALIARHS